jgi:hypothetical protein
VSARLFLCTFPDTDFLNVQLSVRYTTQNDILYFASKIAKHEGMICSVMLGAALLPLFANATRMPGYSKDRQRRKEGFYCCLQK